MSDQDFVDVEVYNAGLSGESLIKFSPVFSFVARVLEAAGKLTDLVSGGRVLWGPLLEVIARKK